MHQPTQGTGGGTGNGTAKIRLNSQMTMIWVRFCDYNFDTFDDLKSMGHIVEKVGAYEEIMGHAGALLCYPNGLKEGGFDLRSDGSAIGG